MAEVDPLILELRADDKGFGSELSSAQRIADARLGAIEKSGAKMSRNLSAGFNLAKGAAVGFIASIGVDAVVQAVKSGLAYAASLGEVAQQLGVTTDELQEYRYAASQAGISTEELDLGLTQLTRRIGEGLQGTKAQAEAFEKLGINLRKANGDVKTAGEVIPEIADAMQQLGSDAERSAIGTDLFGKSFQKFLPLLSGGSKAVNELRDAANRLGIVLSSEQIAKADETADKLDALKQVLAAKISGAVADNADSILELANALVTLVGGIGTAVKEYKRLREEFAIKFQFGVGAALLPSNSTLGSAFLASSQRRSNAARGASLRDRFSNIDIQKGKGARSNFAAQVDPFEAFGAGLSPPVLAAAAIGPNANQAAALKGALNTGQQELLAIFTELSAVAADLIDTVEARVEAEKFQIEAEKLQSIARINANDELTKAQKAQAIQGIEALAAGKIELANAKIEADASARSAEAARDAAELADIQARNAVAQLEDEYDLATSIAERARIAQQIVETETAAALAAIDAQLLQDDITEAKRAQLEAIREGIVAEGEINKRKAVEGNRTASGQYLDDLNRLNAGDQVDQFGVDALKDLNRGLADAIVNGANLGDVLEDTGKRFLAQLIELTFQLLVIKPLLESLGGGSGTGGGGGFFGGLLAAIGGLFGGPRASGGPVRAGRLYRVNEAQQEFFKPNVDGKVLTLGQMSRQTAASTQSQGGTSVVRLELSGDIDARIQQQSAAVAVEVVRAAEPSLTNKAVSETFRRGQRPSIGR